MNTFNKIDGEFVVLTSQGTFRQVDLYERNGYLFAAHGGGYIRLMADGSTSKDRVRYDYISLEQRAIGKLGYLCLPTVEGSRFELRLLVTERVA